MEKAMLFVAMTVAFISVLQTSAAWARYYEPQTGRFIQEDPSPGQVISPNTVLNKYPLIPLVNNQNNQMDPVTGAVQRAAGASSPIMALVPK